MATKVYAGDIGTKIELDCVEDISTATELKIKYKKPDDTTGEWIGTLEGTTKIKYLTLSGDLDTSGDWVVQAYVVLPAWTGHGEAATFTVYELYS